MTASRRPRVARPDGDVDGDAEDIWPDLENPAAPEPGDDTDTWDALAGRRAVSWARAKGRPVRRVGWVVTWTLSTVLVVVGFCRRLGLDDVIGWPFPAINALTPLIYLPAYPILVGTVLRRRWVLAVVVLTIAIMHGCWTVPEFLTSGREEPLGPNARTVRVMTANVNGYNPAVARIGAQLDREHPDLLLLEEFTPYIQRQLTDLPQLRGYRYTVLRSSLAPYGFAVYSRYPLTPLPALDSAGFPFGRMIVTVASGHRFELVVVHTRSPVGVSWSRRWATQLGALRTMARTVTIPLVMAGDFNASRDHRPFRRLLQAGLRDAHDVMGAGWSPTWSATDSWKKTVRIDHILVSAKIEVRSYHRGSQFGSDHLPVSADLRV